MSPRTYSLKEVEMEQHEDKKREREREQSVGIVLAGRVCALMRGENACFTVKRTASG